MATVYWVANQSAVAQVYAAQVTAVAVGGLLTATINGNTVSYQVVSGDTVATATAAWLALLSNTGTAPAEFQQQTFTANGTDGWYATASTAGTPFAGMANGLTVSGTGGCTVTGVITTANRSPSDIADAQNWRRNGVASLPQNGDDVVVADSSVSLLWNLDAMLGTVIASFTRYQSFTGTIGLPENNPAGFYEWRPTYLKLAGGSAGSSSPGGGGGVLQVLLGFGPTGNGPARERYNFQGYQTNCTVLAAGSALDAYSVRILGSNSNNVVTVTGVSVGVAMLPGESASLASATATNGAILDLGPNVSFSGTLTVNGATSNFNCQVPTVTGINNSTLSQGTTAANLTLSYGSITLQNGSSLTWLSPSSLTLVMQTGSTFNKAQDQRPIQMTALTMDADSCVVNDPYGTITYVGSVVTRNVLNSGPFRGPPGYRVPINA